MGRDVCGTGACTQRASIKLLEVDQERNRKAERCLPHCKQRARSQSKAARDCGDANTIRKVPRYKAVFEFQYFHWFGTLRSKTTGIFAQGLIYS